MAQRGAGPGAKQGSSEAPLDRQSTVANGIHPRVDAVEASSGGPSRNRRLADTIKQLAPGRYARLTLCKARHAYPCTLVPGVGTAALGWVSGGETVCGAGRDVYAETRATSSIEVIPRRTLCRPSSRRLSMPSSRATVAISDSGAPLTVRSLIRSLICITE